MINERDIAVKFKSIWKQHLPMLNPVFTEGFNLSQVKRINPKQVIPSTVVRYDLVAETAFNLAALAYTNRATPGEIFKDRAQQHELIASTARDINRLRNYTISDEPLADIELADILGIAENTLDFISKMDGQEVTFRPEITGYGFIPNITADLSIDDTLFEIKTVNRNFRSSDLKQLFIYLALRQVSNAENWHCAGLYNPRKGTYSKFNVDNMINDLSGGKTAYETFTNLLNDLNH
jgi:hypothetical protein